MGNGWCWCCGGAFLYFGQKEKRGWGGLGLEGVVLQPLHEVVRGLVLVG